MSFFTIITNGWITHNHRIKLNAGVLWPVD